MIRRWFVAGALALSICAGAADAPPPPFTEVPMPAALPPPPADSAQIVLLEPINKIQGLFPIGIFDMDGDKRTLVGVSSWRSKSIVLLTPGKHTLMASPGGISHYLEANVEAGKRYYVLLRFIYGNGMQLRPLRRSGASEYRIDSPDFPKWIKATTRFVQKSPDAEAYFERWKEQMDKGQEKGLENWQAKTAAEAAELTLNVEDAVPL